MRIVLIAAAIWTGLVAACAPPQGMTGSADQNGYWHRDAPGTVWKRNRVPDGH